MPHHTNPSASEIFDYADPMHPTDYWRKKKAQQALHSAILSRMPEKKSKNTSVGIINSYENGYNTALTDITQVLNDFFGDIK